MMFSFDSFVLKIILFFPLRSLLMTSSNRFDICQSIIWSIKSHETSFHTCSVKIRKQFLLDQSYRISNETTFVQTFSLSACWFVEKIVAKFSILSCLIDDSAKANCICFCRSLSIVSFSAKILFLLLCVA